MVIITFVFKLSRGGRGSFPFLHEGRGLFSHLAMYIAGMITGDKGVANFLPLD